jgi:hypothetical protein
LSYDAVGAVDESRILTKLQRELGVPQAVEIE